MAQAAGTRSIYERWGWVFLVINFLAVGVVAVFGPAEKSLGSNVRVVYLHGAWVWTALAAMSLAGVTGLLGLTQRWRFLANWSLAFGRTGLVFWITYLPLSLWAMQANWNGLFLSEPRWSLAIAFAISGIALQIGLALVNRPLLIGLVNSGYVAALLILLGGAENVMHPRSPILDSRALAIQFFFGSLLVLTLLLGWQVNLLLLRMGRETH